MASNQCTDMREYVAVDPDLTASTPVPSPVNTNGGRVTAGTTGSEGSETASPASPQMLGDMGSRPGSAPGRTSGSAPGSAPGSILGTISGSTAGPNPSSNDEAERVRSEVREALQETLPGALQETLPRELQEALPRAVQEALPRAVQEALPRAVQEALPRAVQEALPRAVQEALPRAIQEALKEAERRGFYSSIVSTVHAVNNYFDESQAFFATKPRGVKYLGAILSGGAVSVVVLVMVESTAKNNDQNIAGWNLAAMVVFVAASGATVGVASQLLVGRIGFFKEDKIFWTILIIATLLTAILAFGFYVNFAK